MIFCGKFPQEIEDMIFDHTGAYTKYLNGKLFVGKNNYEQLTSFHLDEILYDIFENDNYKKCLTLIDETLNTHLHITNNDLYKLFLKNFPFIEKNKITYFTIKNVKNISICVSDINDKNNLEKVTELGYSVSLFYYCLQKRDIICEHRYKETTNPVFNMCKRISFNEMIILINSLNTSDKKISFIIKGLAFAGKLDTLKYLIEKDILKKCDKDMFESILFYATKGDNFDIVKFVNNGIYPCGFTSDATYWAAQHGYLDIFIFLMENNEYDCHPSTLMEIAIKNNHLDIVKWLIENNYKSYIDEIRLAIQYGHLEIVKWLYMKCSEECTNVIEYAAEFGHLEIIKWFYFNTEESSTTYAMDLAERNGHSETVRFLHAARS